jgi:hypothetical protein
LVLSHSFSFDLPLQSKPEANGFCLDLLPQP